MAFLRLRQVTYVDPDGEGLRRALEQFHLELMLMGADKIFGRVRGKGRPRSCAAGKFFFGFY